MSTTQELGTPRAQDAIVANDVGSSGGAKLSILQKMKQSQQSRQQKVMSVDEWLEKCRTDKMAYADYADRALLAIGEPEVIDTKLSTDDKERRFYGQQKVLRYKPFANLYDSEKVIEKLVGYIKNGAKNILVLRGPVGSGKTEIATLAEHLMEKNPVYILRCKISGKLSPFNDTPTALFSDPETAAAVSEEYGIPQRYLNTKLSSWAVKRLAHHEHDIEKAFDVVEVWPSVDAHLAVAKLDPQDPKSANINSLIGEVDITMVGDEDPLDRKKTLSSGDPDAYIPGAFSKSNQGMFHGAEFFRNNPALLNSFLEGVTTGYFTGDKGVGTLPMNQLIIMTTNDPVWKAFMKHGDSDAARNRIKIIDVPYTLRMSEETKIYQKLLKKSTHAEAPIAPKTLDILAEFAIVSRLKDGVNGALKTYDKHIRAQVWNGEIPDGSKGTVPKLNELREKADPMEGLEGFSIREAEDVMKSSFNMRASEGIYESDPLLLLEALEKFVKDQDEDTLPQAKKDEYKVYVAHIKEKYEKDIRQTINQAMIDADDGICQTQFDKYIFRAEKWIDKEDYVDDGSGETINFEKIDKELSSMEKKAGISSSEEFRRTSVGAINAELARIAKRNQGKPLEEQTAATVRWDSYEPMAKVIRAQHEMEQDRKRHIFRAKAEADLKTDEEKRQYSRFYENMEKYGFTPTMIVRHLHRLELN